MSKQTFLTALVAVGVALFAGITPPASAQGPAPSGAPNLDNQWHTIGPGATLWYGFDRADDHMTVTVTLANAVALRLIFNVYAPDRPDTPIGRGTSSTILCNTTVDSTPTTEKCASPDLTWTGGASSAGRYSVQVINNGTNGTNFLLTLSGGSGTPVPGTGYVYYPPYGAPYTVPYGQPYYVAPYTQPYVQPYYPAPYVQPYSGAPYLPPYSPYYNGPWYVAPNQPYCPPKNYPSYLPYNYAQPYCR